MRGRMRWCCLGACLLALFILSGCWVPSVNRMFEDSDLTYDPSLEGKWLADDGNSSVSFARDVQGTCYSIVYEYKGEKTNFKGCTGEIGRNRFLDIEPGELDYPEALHAHLLPAHSFWKMDVGSDTLSLQTLNEEWFNSMIKRKKLPLSAVRHADVGWILTASTASLKKFFQRYGDVAAVYGEKEEFHRQK